MQFLSQLLGQQGQAAEQQYATQLQNAQFAEQARMQALSGGAQGLMGIGSGHGQLAGLYAQLFGQGQDALGRLASPEFYHSPAQGMNPNSIFQGALSGFGQGLMMQNLMGRKQPLSAAQLQGGNVGYDAPGWRPY